jgi:hypothetical protein
VLWISSSGDHSIIAPTFKGFLEEYLGDAVSTEGKNAERHRRSAFLKLRFP